MKSILALGVGLVVALAPGTAFAAPAEAHGTGNGNAYGNCSYSSAGGDTTRSTDPAMAGKGNGGWAKLARDVKDCVVAPVVTDPPVVITVPTTPTDPADDPTKIT